MGHRALVAYRRPDRRYDLRYSHWGGETLSFADEITAATPLADGAVQCDLLATAITRDRILCDYLDPRVHEALYLVRPGADYEADTFRVCWLEWGDGRDGGRGAIVAVRPEDDGSVRIWFRATKTALADIVEMGALSRRAARSYLEARVCEDHGGIPYTYDGSSDAPDGDGTSLAPPPETWLEDRNRTDGAWTDGAASDRGGWRNSDGSGD